MDKLGGAEDMTTLVTKLTNIGNAIRAKTGGSTALSLDAMPQEIASIEGDAYRELLTDICDLET